MDERIELTLAWELPSFHLSYTVLKGNSNISRNKGTSVWNFVSNSRLGKTCFGVTIFELAVSVAQERWTPRA